MEVTIYDAAGRGWLLPSLLRWTVFHGFCSPCDSISVTVPYAPGMLPPLEDACRITAVHQGETVFRGVVDEIELYADAGGAVALLEGRGLQALLMDSQAESADYAGADLAFILGRHATPLGITEVVTEGASDRSASLSVASGESHWSVLSRFTEFCLGLRPRFRPDGTLLLDGTHSGRSFRLGADTAVTAQRYTQERYGVLSRVIVKNRALGTSVAVDDPAFQAMGGQCIRVVNVPRYTYFDAMRHTGQYQLDKSRAEMRRCTLTLPECFAAFPGDRVVLEQSPLGVSGTFTVESSRCSADGSGAETTLELRADAI